MAPLTWPRYLPKVPPPNIITLGVRISTYVDGVTQTLSPSHNRVWLCQCPLRSTFYTVTQYRHRHRNNKHIQNKGFLEQYWSYAAWDMLWYFLIHSLSPQPLPNTGRDPPNWVYSPEMGWHLKLGSMNQISGPLQCCLLSSSGQRGAFVQELSTTPHPVLFPPQCLHRGVWVNKSMRVPLQRLHFCQGSTGKFVEKTSETGGGQQL